MSYTKKSFDRCHFNPLHDNKLVMAYPVLSEILHCDWEDDENLDHILRYLIMVYDPKSPLVADERDLNYRKSIAAELAGLDISNEVLMVAIYESNYPKLGDLIVRYLQRFAKSKEWAAICAYEASFWESIRKLMEPITGKTSREELDSVQKKSAIKDEVDKDIRRLDEYYRKFLGEDEELEKKARKRISPEQMADSR